MEKNNIISGCAPTKLRLNTWYATSKSVPPLVDRPCTYTKNVFLCIHRVANKKYLENVDSQSRVTNLTQKKWCKLVTSGPNSAIHLQNRPGSCNMHVAPFCNTSFEHTTGSTAILFAVHYKYQGNVIFFLDSETPVDTYAIHLYMHDMAIANDNMLMSKVSTECQACNCFYCYMWGCGYSQIHSSRTFICLR